MPELKCAHKSIITIARNVQRPESIFEYKNEILMNLFLRVIIKGLMYTNKYVYLYLFGLSNLNDIWFFNKTLTRHVDSVRGEFASHPKPDVTHFPENNNVSIISTCRLVSSPRVLQPKLKKKLFASHHLIPLLCSSDKRS